MYKDINVNIGIEPYRLNRSQNCSDWIDGKWTVSIALTVGKVQGRNWWGTYHKKLLKVVVDDYQRAEKIAQSWQEKLDAAAFNRDLTTGSKKWVIARSADIRPVYQDLKTYFPGKKGWAKFLRIADLTEKIDKVHLSSKLMAEFRNAPLWCVEYPDGRIEKGLLGCDAEHIFNTQSDVKIYLEYNL